ncbi:MAG: hypothetical protein NC543_01070 [bacterium]|nr:hypothetical protein [bacterium]MCM1375051.1 hypothetical protein [Muribaculum sp.]
MEKNRQTVSVLDEQDTVIGHTYPKRAKGLVKKRRAEFVSDNAIRLHRQCPTYENMEDKEMDQTNFITVHPTVWRKNPDGANKTVSDRFMISNPLFGAVANASSLVEVLSVGTWNWDNPSYVTNGFQELTPNTEYHFVFWLNGGENDRSDETCQLQILFTDDNITASNREFTQGMCFRLNRGYIKPLKKYKGWEYYDIPFTTTQARYTQFQFVADRAPMALMDAVEPDLYRDLQDVTDPYEKRRPQRHNIIFEDGWPVNRWYSTENLAQGKGDDEAAVKGFPFDSQFNFKPPMFNNFNWSGLTEDIASEVMDNLDLDELQENMGEEIRESILEQLNIDSLRNEIMESVRRSLLHPSN